MADSLFCALLRFWRTQRGFSQLDLALEAEVSSRHLSFLETGRSKPSREMVLRLMSVLGVSLRDQNQVLAAAGFGPAFQEPAPDQLDPAFAFVLDRMMEKHEPYPLTVMDGGYDIVRANRGALRVFSAFLPTAAESSTPLNLMALVFDPHLARPFITNWEEVARSLLARVHREVLQSGQPRRRVLLETMLGYPGVPRRWATPDFSQALRPLQSLKLSRNGLKLEFLTTMTEFSSPRQVTIEELRIESYFPVDDDTRRICESEV